MVKGKHKVTKDDYMTYLVSSKNKKEKDSKKKSKTFYLYIIKKFV